MSVAYWIIEGVGVRMNDIPLNPKKCRAELVAYYEECGKKDVVSDITDDDIEVADFWYETDFSGISDFVAQIADSYLFSNDDNEGNEYLYFGPVLPWQFCEGMPKSLAETHDCLYEAVNKVSDISQEDFEKLIDDNLYVFCCG